MPELPGKHADVPISLHRNDERTPAALVVDRITVLVFQEYAILNGDRRQFACPSSQESMRTFRLCLIVQDSERSTLTLGRPESHFRRVHVFLPALWSHRVSEQSLICAALQTITPRFLFVGPSRGQILD